jgi:hypothetical protein
MRKIQKSFNKATHKIDAFALNTLQGLGQVSVKIKNAKNQDSAGALIHVTCRHFATLT